MEDYLEALRVQADADLLPIDKWFALDHPLADYDTEAQTIRYALAGVFFWDNPLWWRLLGWYFFPRGTEPTDLEQARAVAVAIVSGCPDDPLDPDLIARLRYVTDGDFCTAYQGNCSVLGIISVRDAPQ